MPERSCLETRGKGRIHGAKSASRRNTIGQAIATIADHVTSGHRQRAGSDQWRGAAILTASAKQRQDPDHVEAVTAQLGIRASPRRIAGVKYNAAITIGSAADRRRSPATSISANAGERDPEDLRRILRFARNARRARPRSSTRRRESARRLASSALSDAFCGRHSRRRPSRSQCDRCEETCQRAARASTR